MYCSIVIEGAREDILPLQDKFDGTFSLEALCPVPEKVSNPITWEKANWGTVEISDVYYATHKQTKTVKACIMAGFESDSSVSRWVKHVARKNPELKIVLDVDEKGNEEYVSSIYEHGQKVVVQPTLF